MRLARRPITLKFATLSTVSKLVFSDQLDHLERTSRERGVTLSGGMSAHVDSKNSDASLDVSNLSALWSNLRDHVKKLQQGGGREDHTYETKRAKFCRSVAVDPQSKAVKWVMKNLKLKGKYRHYGKAWSGKGMYRKDIRPVQERAICAALLKHSGLWKCVQERTLPLPNEMKDLVECMYHSFTRLKDRAKRAELEALSPSRKTSTSRSSSNNNNNNNRGGESKLENQSAESKSAGGEHKSSSSNNSNYGGESKRQRRGSMSGGTTTTTRGKGRGKKKGKSQFASLMDTLDLKPLYVADEDFAGFEGTEEDHAMNSVFSDPIQALNDELSQIVARCEFLLDIVPVSVTSASDASAPDSVQALDSVSHARSGCTSETKTGAETDFRRGGLRQATAVREDTIGNVSMSSTLRSIHATSNNLVVDTDLIEDIEARERNKAYDRRFSECVSYIFDHTSSTWSAARASSPSVLLQLIQIRSRRAYHRAYGEQAMATLLVQQKELFVGGDCVNESIRALLETHAAFRGITANEARARYQSWQEGGWENLVFSSHAAYNSRNAYTQRLHHYSTSLGAAGYHAFSEVKKGFRLLFVVLVNTLSECLHTLQGMQNGAQSKEALVATVHGFLSALAIDYEPQDAQMILDSGLIPLLHGQISMGNRGHERARGPGDGIRTSMCR